MMSEEGKRSSDSDNNQLAIQFCNTNKSDEVGLNTSVEIPKGATIIFKPTPEEEAAGLFTVYDMGGRDE